MLARYKEIWYGILFGFGAIGIDLLMHARMQKRSVLEELLDSEPAGLIYRAFFLAFGVALGWLLWRNNTREREFRNMQDDLQRLTRQVSTFVTLSYSKLQIILARSDGASSAETANMLHAMRDDLQRLRGALDAPTSSKQSSS